jgi:hypothetical protein
MHATCQRMSGIGRLTQHNCQRLWLPLAILLWLASVVLSWRAFLTFDFTGDPAPIDSASAWWPHGSLLTLDNARPTVLFFMHPKCPCTRASLAELERLWVLRDERDLARSPRLVVVATVPRNASADWLTTDTLERVQQLQNTTVVIDPEGCEAKRFGAATSGTVMWFAASGRRLYSGGITASRGHEGGNVGLACLVELVRGRTTPTRGLPALGCPLCLPEPETSTHRLAGE